MSAFALSPWDQFFYDFNLVGIKIISLWRQLLMNLYGNSRYNYLLYMALVPTVLMICVDIIFSFILSVRCREFRLFNCLSSRSWHSLRVNTGSARNNRLYSLSVETKNHPRDFSLRSFRLSDLSLRLTKYRNAKAGDVIRCQDGTRFFYVGLRLDAKNKPLYAYRTNNGVYYSYLNPHEWSVASGSERKLSIAKVLRKKSN